MDKFNINEGLASNKDSRVISNFVQSKASDAGELVMWGKRTLQKEAEALSAFVETLDHTFAQVAEMIFHCRGTVLLTGMGKSGLVARKWASTFSGTGTKSYFINPAEASHGDLGVLQSEDILIALSYSGETEELSPILRFARESNIPTIGITGNLASSLARQSQMTLSVSLSEEACPLGLAPTSSTTLMMALGDALASTLMQMRGFTEVDFARLHPGGSLGRRLWLRVSEMMHTGDAIPLVHTDDAFEKVLVEMTQKRLGLAVVVDKTNPAKSLGLITDGDLRRCLQKGKGYANVVASDMMTANPRKILATALALDARELMEQNTIHHLLVVDSHDNLVGVIHFDDLLRRKVL